VDNRVAWGPRPVSIALIGVGGILMALACLLLDDDIPGQILTAGAAVGLLIFAVGSWRARPRLAMTDAGLVYRGWWRTRTLRPPDIATIRITEFRRLGRKAQLLEIDTSDDSLLVLSRWDLGGDPLTVLDVLTDAGYAGR
jgi:hypothetical protein